MVFDLENVVFGLEDTVFGLQLVQKGLLPGQGVVAVVAGLKRRTIRENLIKLTPFMGMLTFLKCS